MKRIYVYVIEMKETYVFPTINQYKYFDSVEFTALDNKVYHGIVIEEGMAVNLHDGVAKIIL